MALVLAQSASADPLASPSVRKNSSPQRESPFQLFHSLFLVLLLHVTFEEQIVQVTIAGVVVTDCSAVPVAFDHQSEYRDGMVVLAALIQGPCP